MRTGKRPAALAFIRDEGLNVDCSPSLTKSARLPAEPGPVEFKAFDGCDNFRLYGVFFALLKGVALDDFLGGRAEVPDQKMHQKSALRVFHDDLIGSGAEQILMQREPP